MKKTVTLLLVISILINLVLVYLFVIKGDVVSTNDERVAIRLSEANRSFALAEMRGFLESVQQINEGILNNNAQLVIDAGKKSGGSVIEHAPKGMMKALPSGFKKIGFSTHALFDEIAKDAENNFNPKHTQEQLNILLHKCTACHSSFKIVTSPK